MVEFAGGVKSLGLSFVERRLVIHDLAMKLILLFCFLGFMIRYYKKYLIKIVLAFFVTGLFAYLMTNTSMAIIFSGNYLATISFKAALLYPAFLLMCYALTTLGSHEHRLTLLALFLVILSWLNIANNAQSNISNVHRDEAPVFGGVNQSSHLKFSTLYSQLYSSEMKKLHPDDLVL